MADGTLVLAQMLKERDNKKSIGIIIGIVEKVKDTKKIQDVTISFFDGTIFKNKFPTLINNFTKDDIGKKVIADVGEDNQTFFVLGFLTQFPKVKEGKENG